MSEAYLRTGLIINTTKTDILSTLSPDAPTFSISGNQPKNSENFAYLGSNLSFSGDLTNEIQRRINLASSAFGSLSKRVFGNKNPTISTKIAVYDADVISTILHSCETWSMLLYRQLCWLGHVVRMPHSRLPHCVLYGHLRLGRRSVGGQNKRFKDHIKSILIKCNIPISRLETLASNRSTCAFGMSCFDDEYNRAAALRCSRRHQNAPVPCPIPDSVHQCPLCGRLCFSRICLLSHSKIHFQR